MLSKEVNKIVVRAPNWIGDAVMATPTLSALRHIFHTAEIVLLAKPAVAALFEQHPDIDRVMIYKDPGEHSGIAGFFRLIGALRRESFDLAFLLQNALEAALLAFFPGIPKRLGYATDGRGVLLTARLKKQVAPAHRSDAYLALLELTHCTDANEGISKKKKAPTLMVATTERESARVFLKSLGVDLNKCLVGVNPGAAYGTAKRWLPERFAEVADRLVDQFQVQILIFGGGSEVTVAETIQAKMQADAVILTGKTTVRQMMACIQACRLFISNDSGPMHVASALKVPQVAVFGPTNPKASFSNGPHDVLVQNQVECAPCRHRDCPIDHRCMTGLEADLVYDAAVRLLTTPQTKRPAVFIDRDGTLNPDDGYIDSISRFSLFPGVGKAVARLNDAGFFVVLVTNQSGIARGLFDAAFVDELHLYMQRCLAREGAYFDGIYFCPHHPDWMPCDCRKPAGGMINQALSDLPIEFSSSYIVGDKVSDMLLAKARLPGEKAQCILVKTGEGESAYIELKDSGKLPDHVARNFPEAVNWILKQKPKIKIEE